MAASAPTGAGEAAEPHARAARTNPTLSTIVVPHDATIALASRHGRRRQDPRCAPAWRTVAMALASILPRLRAARAIAAPAATAATSHECPLPAARPRRVRVAISLPPPTTPTCGPRAVTPARDNASVRPPRTASIATAVPAAPGVTPARAR